MVGQGLVNIINFAVGILVLRLLPVSEYAAYITAGVLLVAISTGSDMGLSQAVNTLAARVRESVEEVTKYYVAAHRMRRLLFAVAVPAIVVVGWVMMQSADRHPAENVGILATVIVTSWVIATSALKKPVLNINQDSRAIFNVGLAEGLTRLGMLGLVWVWPTAFCVLLVNLAATVVARRVMDAECRVYLKPGTGTGAEHVAELKRFSMPLVPAVLYYLVQGQVSVFLLSVFGYHTAVAEVGALGRLGQAFSLISMLNPFLVQPHFARIASLRQFIKHASVVICVVIALCVTCMWSVWQFGPIWLAILGLKYGGLTRELPVAMAGSVLSLLGSTAYTIVVSRNMTSMQSWTIVAGLGGQCMFLWLNGITAAGDALLLNVIPVATYALAQLSILAYIVVKWSNSGQASTS